MLASLYQSGPHGFWTFLLVTLVLGGAAAYATGQAIAETWRPAWQIPVYMLLLAAAVRFVQFSVLGASLLSFSSYVIDFLVLLGIAAARAQVARKAQMARQYGWRGGASR